MTLSIEDASNALGMPLGEVVAVEETSAGIVVTTADSARMVLAGEPLAVVALYGRPDGRPVDDPDAPPYAFPVIEPDREDEPDLEPDADEPEPEDGDDQPEPEDEDEDPIDLGGMTKVELLEYADGLELEVDAKLKVGELRDYIENATRAKPEDGDE